MSNDDRDRTVDEVDEKYSDVDAEDVVEDALDLFEKDSEGPPAANPWAARPPD